MAWFICCQNNYRTKVRTPPCIMSLWRVPRFLNYEIGAVDQRHVESLFFNKDQLDLNVHVVLGDCCRPVFRGYKVKNMFPSLWCLTPGLNPDCEWESGLECPSVRAVHVFTGTSSQGTAPFAECRSAHAQCSSRLWRPGVFVHEVGDACYSCGLWQSDPSEAPPWLECSTSTWTSRRRMSPTTRTRRYSGLGRDGRWARSGGTNSSCPGQPPQQQLA